MGDIRDAEIDQAYTRESLLAVREADAAKMRRRRGDEADPEEGDDG